MMTGRLSRPGARWLAATAAAITGCAMLVTSGHASGASAAGVALALLASVCYAVYTVTASHLITNGAGDCAVVGAIFGGAAVLLIPALFTSLMSWVATGQGLGVATYLAVLTTALAYLIYAPGAAHHGGDDRDRLTCPRPSTCRRGSPSGRRRGRGRLGAG
jgi:DME family drug/metabolite transporter